MAADRPIDAQAKHLSTQVRHHPPWHVRLLDSPTWFDTARLGMFVHWSHCSQRGREVSWPLVGGLFALPYCSDVAVDEYHATAATFDPQKWDARELARTAKRMGMQYAVITAKHHDGYAMYHTKQS